MKFERLLEEYHIAEWSDAYLPYGFLKKRLYDIAEGRGGAALASIAEHREKYRASSLGPLQRRTTLDTAWALVRPVASSSSPTSAVDAAAGKIDGVALEPTAEEAWKSLMEAELLRIGKFVDGGLQGLRGKFIAIAQQPATAATEARRADGYNLELRQLEMLSRVAEDVEKLRGFSDLNHVALFKIMKKYGKVLKADDGPELQAKWLKQAKLGDVNRFDELSASIREAFLRSSPCQGLQGSLAAARLAAGLSAPSAEIAVGGRSWAARNGERLLFFFLGSSTSLFLAICILIALPCKQPKTFSTAYLLANFCAFRIVLSVVLTLWAMGTVARVCEEHFINANFLLGVDPRCRISPNYLFLLAALLTSAWIVIFGLYVIDYKWMVLPAVDAKHAYNKRASGIFVVYPVAVLCFAAVMAISPSRVCRNRYKRAIFGTVRRTALAPFFEVSFADNIAGDVLTSLAKPLQEVPATLCYLVGNHPMRRGVVERFIKNGSVCPEWEQSFLSPMIAGAPFWFRLLQCARRFFDTKDSRHLLNLGKYAASLLVVIVTACSTSKPLIVAVSAVATVYAAAWDVWLDWGLEARTLLRSFGREAPPSPCRPRLRSGQSELDGTPTSGLPEEDLGCSSRYNISMQRHFSPRFYCFAVVADVVARFSWVLTLMPTTLLADDIVQRALLQTFMTTVEIARRALWAILRLENEQVTNASGYRSFLWVPLKVNPPRSEALREAPLEPPPLPLGPRGGAPAPALSTPLLT